MRKDYPELILDGDECVKAYGVFDFCKRVKIRGNDQLLSNRFHDNILGENKEQKMTRYYISNQGVQLIKQMPPLKTKIGDMDKYIKEYPNEPYMFDINEFKVVPKRRNELEAGLYSTVFNKYVSMSYDQYNINESYYISEAYKVIDVIKPRKNGRI